MGKTSYSDNEMKALILDLAKNAEPLEASALREVAQNYSTPAEPVSKHYELKLRHLLGLVAAVYAIMTPVFLLDTFTPDPVPTGRVVEQLGGFTRASENTFTTRTFKFAQGPRFVNGVPEWIIHEDPIPLVVYEGMTRLPEGSYDIQEPSRENVWRYVTLKMSDGSDPNRNGKRYYVVLP